MSSLFHWSDTVAIWTHNIVEPITVISNLYLFVIAVVYIPAPMKVRSGIFSLKMCKFFQVYSSLIIYHSGFDIFASFSTLMASPRYAYPFSRSISFLQICLPPASKNVCLPRILSIYWRRRLLLLVERFHEPCSGPQYAHHCGVLPLPILYPHRWEYLHETDVSLPLSPLDPIPLSIGQISFNLHVICRVR